MITQSERESIEGVQRVEYKNRMVRLHFTGGSVLNFGDDLVSGATSMNVNYAVVAPELFDYYLLSGKLLHVICPYTAPHTGLLGTYVREVTNGHITI